MTVENSKKLYKHYVEIGYDKAAKDLLRKYPEFNDGNKGDKTDELQSGDSERTDDSKGNTRKKK